MEPASPYNPQTSLAISPASSLSLVGVARWQRRFLTSLLAGATEHEARHAANASPMSIDNALAANPAFARAFDQVTQHRALVGVDTLRQQALAMAPDVLEDAYDASKVARYERDRLGNRRLLLEVTQAVGAGAAHGGTGVPVIQLGVSVHHHDHHEHQEPHEHGDARTSDQSPETHARVKKQP